MGLRVLVVFLSGLLGVLCGCAGSHEVTSAREKAELFETFFGFAMPESVSDLKGRRVHVGDTMSDWLAVRCDDAVFERVVRSTGAEAVGNGATRGGYTSESANPNRPDWWPPLPDAQPVPVHVLDRPFAPGRSQSDRLVFWRDPNTRWLYAYFAAWR